jgi:hypothetical protein
MLKHTLATTAFAALMLSSAFAQSSPPMAVEPSATTPMAASPTTVLPSPASDTFLNQQSSNEWRASQLIGSNVIGPDNTKIGDINDVLVDNSGAVRAVVMGVGGILGVGEKDVAISLKSLIIGQSTGGDKIEKLSISFTKDQIKDAPAFKWNQAAAALPSDKRSENLPRK